MSHTMRELFELLEQQIPAGTWWPGESRFEIVIGAVLTQNTSWHNVESAIDNLREAGMLSPERLLAASDETVASLIRPCGYYNTKTRYLKELTSWFIERDQHTEHLSTPQLREELLRIRGVGEETADDLLLYIYDRPVFIYDLYARRLLAAAGYGEYRNYTVAKRTLDPLIEHSQFTTAELAKFHGLIVDGGKRARQLGGWERAYPLLVSGDFNAD
ncbi:endonuclease III domain-containing protein [Arcanobacterium phocae]|uniref:endonuclease III domain-containing protein n=1 Tax=Arcanobacterium phocae TaxID=131112 RepID=UPI001C0F0B31|nr:deoxyribonuclease [Arcanobacterium phocae]